MKVQQTSEKPSWKQLGSLAGFIIEYLATILSFSNVSYWLAHKSELKKKLRDVFSIVDDHTEVRIEWQTFYKTQLGWDVDFSLVSVPERPDEGDWRLIFIPKGLTPNKVFDSWTFKKWRYTDNLDTAVSTNRRTSKEEYAIWVRIGVEPDDKYLGKSTREADLDMSLGMTLLERMVLEAKYFAETGGHLDIDGATFCSGSRNSDGSVPYVYWFPDNEEVYVYWDYLGHSGEAYGLREAVSL